MALFSENNPVDYNVFKKIALRQPNTNYMFPKYWDWRLPKNKGLESWAMQPATPQEAFPWSNEVADYMGGLYNSSGSQIKFSDWMTRLEQTIGGFRRRYKEQRTPTRIRESATYSPRLRSISY